MQTQANLDGKGIKSPDSAKPWKGICCKACWFARGKRCTCRCHKAFHGFSHSNHPETLIKYRVTVKADTVLGKRQRTFTMQSAKMASEVRKQVTQEYDMLKNVHVTMREV
jgi:hypothetical protein